jgi:hypothetical protein
MLSTSNAIIMFQVNIPIVPKNREIEPGIMFLLLSFSFSASPAALSVSSSKAKIRKFLSKDTGSAAGEAEKLKGKEPSGVPKTLDAPEAKES